jgi:hypothetical protein
LGQTLIVLNLARTSDRVSEAPRPPQYPNTGNALEELDNAVSREAELRPREASFWQAISDFIAQRLAMLNFD